MSASRIGRRLDGVGLFSEHLLRNCGGRGNIAAGQLCLGHVESSQRAGLAVLQDIFIALFVELSLARAVYLVFDVHAVHHLADGIFQAGRIFFNCKSCS